MATNLQTNHFASRKLNQTASVLIAPRDSEASVDLSLNKSMEQYLLQAALEQVFSKYFGYSYQFHQLLDIH
jgi:hypothetical protein